MILWEATGKPNDLSEMDEYLQLNTSFYVLDALLDSEYPLTAYHINRALEEEMAMGETEENVTRVLEDLKRQGYVIQRY